MQKGEQTRRLKMEDKTLLGFLIALLVISLGIFSFAWVNNNNEIEASVDFTEQNDRLTALEGSVNDLIEGLSPEVEEEGDVAPGSFVLSKSDFEEEAAENEALKLVMESVNSRDFKRAVFTLLSVEHNVDIEGYQDITEVRVLDSDVDVDNENAKVELNVKVYYFLGGDEDETERARLGDFTVEVDRLDFDEDFEDADLVDEDAYLTALTVKRIFD